MLTGKRCILYMRVSLADLNLNNQEVPLRRFCELHQIEIVAQFSDRISGRTDDRPGLRRALQALRKPEVDLLLCWSIDRLGRSLRHLLHVVDEIRSIPNKGLYLVKENLDLTGSSAQSDLFLGVFGSLANFESALCSERTKTALAVARLSGKTLGRPSKITEPIRQKVLGYREQGVAIREIARLVPEISRGSIQTILRDFKKQRAK